MTMICAGCAKGPGQAVLERELPAPPDSLLRTVPAPPIAKGDDPKARLAQTRDALDEANGRIVNGRAWYEGVRKDF
jgi:hypothetical protein